MTIPSLRSESGRKTVYAAAVLLVFCAILLEPVNCYLAATLKQSYYRLLGPVLICAALQFAAPRRSVELRLLIALGLWFWLSRALCGDPALAEDAEALLDFWMIFPFLALGLILDAEGRRRFLHLTSAVMGAVFTVLGTLGLIAFVCRIEFVNPITQDTLSVIGSGRGQTIRVLNLGINHCGMLFILSFLLMLWEFITCKHRLWRVPLALAGLVQFCAACVTFARSAQLVCALSLGALAAAGLLPRLRRLRVPLRAALLTLVFLLTTALSFKLSDWCGSALLLAQTPDPVQLEESIEEPPAPAETDATEASSPPEASDAEEARGRGLFERLDELSTGRLRIWGFVLQSLRNEPLAILRGHLMKDVMRGVEPLVPESFALINGFPGHTHNSLTQILLTMGLPGFALALALMLRIVFVCVRGFLSADPRVALGQRLLLIIPVASLAYFMLEPWLFLSLNTAAFCYYLLCGLALGSLRESGTRG